MDLKSIFLQLRPLEQRVVAPFEVVDPVMVQAMLREQADSVALKVSSVSGQHCPFEIIFGRGKFESHVSIFLGKGAEFCNAEQVDTHNQALELGEDIRQLASSMILAKERVGRGRSLEATYTVQFRDGRSLKLRWSGTADSDDRVESRIAYTPWLS